MIFATPPVILKLAPANLLPVSTSDFTTCILPLCVFPESPIVFEILNYSVLESDLLFELFILCTILALLACCNLALPPVCPDTE